MNYQRNTLDKSISHKKPTRVLIVQQINRAYRVPLLTKLSQRPEIDLTMVYGTTPPVQAGDIGISIAVEPMPFRTISGPIGGIRFKGREFLWFELAVKTLKQQFFDVVICDYYIRLLSIWPMQSIQHRRGANFILWGIGFHQHPTPLIDLIRMMMVKRTDALLLYSENESKRYQNMGVPTEKCFVTQNTVDIEAIDAAVAATSQTDILACREKMGVKNSSLLIHVGRLAQNKRLDLLIYALAKLRDRKLDTHLVLVGEGPEMQNLSQLAAALSISDAVHFLGPITDHIKLAPWVLASDLFVAPGQIGLMAPMCMAYGKTLVISNIEKQHGPEVQVFSVGQTGLDYKFGDIEDLTQRIRLLLNNSDKRKDFEKTGFARVRKMMGPEQMLDSFFASIDYVMHRRRHYHKPKRTSEALNNRPA